MANYTIDDFTQDTVTITASGLTSGSAICILIYLYGDESAVIAKAEYTVTGDSTTKTFDGLEPSTDYTVNVYDGTEWLGTEDFTTEAAPVVDANGRLLTIPVLSSDYPLFNWGDWPDSYAALVPDGLTSEFEKDCWNAIVDKLAGAFAVAGIPWNSAYTTYEDTRITKAYGDLYAKMMNSLRHNINRPAPLGGWNWACDPSFRGYIGREDFRGVDAYGESGADDVYPEYFKELVRKLNLLLEIMRCNGHIKLIQAVRSIDTTAYSRAIMRRSIQFGCYGSSFARHHNRAIQVGPAAVVVVDPFSTNTLSLHDFYSGVGGRLIVYPFGTTTRSLNLMRRGRPVYLETNKKLISTEFLSNFRAGHVGRLIHFGNVFLRNTDAFRLGMSALLQYSVPGITSEYVSGSLGTSALLQYQTPVVASAYALLRPGISACLEYYSPVFTVEHTYGRPGVGAQVSKHVEVVTDIFAPFRGGSSVAVQHSKSVLTLEHAFFRGGTGAQVQRTIDVATNILAPFRAGTVVPLQYSTPVFTLEWAAGRAGTGAQVSRIIEVATGILAPFKTGQGAQVGSWEISHNAYSAAALGAYGLQIDGAVAKAATGIDALFRPAPYRRIEGRGFSYTDAGAKALQASSAFVSGESSSYTTTKRAKVSQEEAAPLQGRGRSETDHSEAHVRSQLPAPVQAEGLSSTENVRGILRLADAPKTSAHGLSVVRHQSGIAVGTPIGQMALTSSTRERAATDSMPGLTTAAYAKIKSTSSKISFAASTNMECQFSPSIVKTSLARLSLTAMGTHATIGVNPQDVSSTYKALNIMAQKAGSVELDAYDVGTKEIKLQAVAGVAGLAQPGVPSVSLSYRQPEIITGFPVDFGIVPDKFPVAECCSADQLPGTEFVGRGRTGMKNRVSLNLGQLKYLSGSGTAETKASATVDFFTGASVRSSDVSKTPCSVVLGTAWLPPVWEDGGLLIQQVQQNATWLEDGLLILEFSGTAAWLEDGLLILTDCFTTVSNNILEVV